MTAPRRLDIERVKNTFRGRSSSQPTNHTAQQAPTRSTAGVYVGETPYHYDAIAMPTMKLAKKESSSDVRKLGSRKGQAQENGNGWSAQDTNGQFSSREAPLPPVPRTANGSSIAPRSWSPHDYGQSFDLAPPPPKHDLTTIDGLSERLFSDDHLRLILRDPTHFLRFTTFINKFRLQIAPLLNRYLEIQKAIKAIEYANAVAVTIHALPQDHASFIPCAAAMLDGRFEARSRRAFEALVNDGLSSYITRVLVDAVADTMIKEITGSTLPVMRDLVGGLAEVFCLTDPSLKDNPIVYASEEFYRTTQYGRDYVIGRNCRFLQGPRTHQPAIARISTAISKGEEICETVLNYRRDGSPFLNLLMIAPLYDNRGAVRYFIGAQVDVTRLVEEGRGIDSFERLLAEDRQKAEAGDPADQENNDSSPPKKPLEALGELGEMLSWEETMEIQTRSRTASLRDDVSVHSMNLNGMKNVPTRPGGRRVLGTDNDDEGEEKATWGLSGSGLSGRLPGVYQNYLLVRPYPSLRIIFVSPALRIPGLLQSRFLSRIGGPSSIRDGIEDALANGVPVTAKVSWLPHGRPDEDFDDSSTHLTDDADFPAATGGRDRDRTAESWYSNGGNRHGVAEGPHAQARTRWLSCTPLLGSDDRVGVWMVVMVEDSNPGRVIGVRAASAAGHHNNSNAISSLANGHVPHLSADSLRKAPVHTSFIRKPQLAETKPVRSPELTKRHLESLRSNEHLRGPPPNFPSPPPSPGLIAPSASTSLHTKASPRSPGSWSPTLSAAAVESWIPTGYGGGVLAPAAAREGRRELEFAGRRQGREFSAGNGGKGVVKGGDGPSAGFGGKSEALAEGEVVA